jgi:tRNA(Ile)-lysidine synthase
VSNIDIDIIFSSDVGEKIYEDVALAISDFNMDSLLAGGVLVGFSGGPDSVMLLCALRYYFEKNKISAPLVACHINHMIRGEEANRDEDFSRMFAEAMGVQFISYRRDIPTLSMEKGISLEEAARNVRYTIFNDYINEREDLSCVAVAHNATDNLETMIFNMFRGSGCRGLSGIAPVRDKILRPLIYVSKSDIMEILNQHSVPYVIDSTNTDTSYTRNYIRSEILPRLNRLSPSPEKQATRLSHNLREQMGYIESEAERFISSNITERGIPTDKLSQLNRALFSEVLLTIGRRECVSLESTHVNAIRTLMNGKDFAVSLPGGRTFLNEKGYSRITVLNDTAPVEYSYRLVMGENYIPEIDRYVILSDKKINNSSSNVYKISIQRAIDFDIIKGGLLVRNKQDGDSYVYGGMTRRLKKLFNDRKLSADERLRLPIICDDDGILWVPGFSLRDGASGNSDKKVFISIAEKINKERHFS